MQQAYVIMSRVPEPGKTKTRLLPWLSPEEACRLHVHILQQVSGLVRTLPGKHYLFYTGGTVDAFAGIVPEGFIFRQQEGPDLGARMDHAFRQVFKEQAGKVLMVGSDIPLLTADHFRQGMALLEQADLVLGPDYGGGYYLIGLKQQQPELFAPKHWGSGQVFRNTLELALKLGLKVELLPPERDIDTYQDLVEVVASLAQDGAKKQQWLPTFNFLSGLINR